MISSIIRKKASRKLGSCYCGAPQKCLINKRSYRVGEHDNALFFVVCAATGRSMRHCM